MKKHFVRVLSVILTVVLLSQVAPLSGISVSAASAVQQTADIPSAPGEPQEPTVHVGEDESLRSLDSKHFRNKDGSYTAVQYPQPIHFQDAQGDWQEINNTLVDNGASYTPKANGLNVSLPKALGEGSRVTMFDVGVGLAISVPGADSEAVTVNAENNQPDTNALPQLNFENNLIPNPVTFANQKIETVPNQRSAVYYPNAFPGADLEYVLESDKLKENVIVSEKQDEYVYKFTLDMNNLIAVPQKDGSIQLIDAKTTQARYKIESPYAFDANGEIAEDVLTLSLDGNILTLTADPKWMNADDRAFPVVLDPTYIHIYDAFGMTEVSVSSQWGKLSDIGFKLKVGAKPGVFGPNKYRSYMRFDMPSLPGDAVVLNSSLMLDANNASLLQKFKDWADIFTKQTPDHKEDDKLKVNIRAEKLTSTWGELTGWTTRPDKGKDNEEAICIGQLPKDYSGKEAASGDKYSFDITSVVKEWISGESVNYGIVLKADDETKTKDNYLEFASLRANFTTPLIIIGALCEEDFAKHTVLFSLPWKTLDENFNIIDVTDSQGRPLYLVATYDANIPILVNYFDAEPCLQIDYICNTGLESYWSYEKVPMGRAGTAYVNQYNGGLTYVHADAETTGERMPVSLAHTYVSNHTNNSGKSWGMKLGVGFRLNVFEEILPLNCYESKSGAIIETGSEWKDFFIGAAETIRNIYEAIKFGLTDENFPDSWLEFSSEITLPDYYTLIDGDGTEHRYVKKEARYENEINSKIYLELDSDKNLVMKDEYGNQKTYSPLRTERDGTREYVYRYLTSIKDVNGNETKIIYDAGSGKIKQVVDTVQRPINLAYDGDYLKSITDPVGRMTTFSYNTEKNWLTGVNYFDNKKTELTYSEFSDRNQNAWHRSQISIVTSPEGHQYGFVYNRVDSFESSGYRVRELQHGIGGIAVTYDPKEGQGGGKSEYWWQKSQIATGFVNFVTPVWDWIAEHVILPILRIFDKNWIYQKEARWFYRQEDAPEYGDDDAKKIDFTDATELETTKFEYRPNQTKISYPLQNDDAAVTYVFDRLGRAVGARDESSGNAAFISFTEDEGVKNLPGYSAGAADVNNLLKNPSNENDGAWTGGQMETADVFAGKRAWKVSSRGSLSQNSISVESGQTYTISVFAKSLAPSGKATLNYGNDSTALDLTDTWERHTATFQADSNSIKVSIQAVGDILVDVIQLEKNGGASPFNYVENSHFNQGTSNWKLFKDDTEVSGNAKNNQYAVPGSVTEKYALVQEIPFNGTKGEMVIFGATAKASATSEEFYAYAEFFRANGTLISDDEKARKVSFNRDLDGTINQTAAVSYPLPENCASMKLYIIYDKQANPLTVSNAFVYTGVGGAKYDYANGKLDKVTTGSGTANYAYRGPEVSSVEIKRPRKESANPDAYTLEKVEFTYDNSDKHHVMSEKVTVDGTETSYTEYQYDQSHYWVLTSSSTWESLAKKNAGDVHASQEISYINNYNDVRRVTDGSGLWGEYTYDSANRNIITQSEASDGSVYTYHYNEFGADTTPNAYDILTSISSNNGERDYKNEYGYSGHGSNPVSENAPVADMLKNIQHNGTTYSFHYNMLGQVKETLIGSQTITENTYYAKEDEAINAAHKQFALAKTTYANGSSYEPVYDEKGRVVGDIYDGKATPNYTYTYSNDNALSKVENKDTGTTTQLGFDMTGRLTDVYAYKNQNIYDRVRLGYNKKGDFTGLKVLSNGSQLSNTTYEYDDRDRLKTVTAGGSAFSYEYNAGFDRLSKVTHASAGAATSYTYFQNGTNATSVLTQMSTTLPGDTFTYDYTYPQDGSSLKSSNIETISENGVLKHSYTYDKIGQLTDDNTMHYAYDAGGNLLSITDTGSNTTLHSFTYNDASWDGGNPGWKDQLQYFDGQKLTYDELGSLKTYNGNTYTWQKASQLASISGNVNAQYTYDYTGLRSSKTVDATTTRYIWAGGLLVAQDDGTNAIAWSYDGGGSMLGFTLNGTPYFYIRNLQGDVVGIYDASGTVVATYEYDAWGNQLTPQLPGSIGDLNPIRYRGYYYDTETEFYYCQSRYYNPVWCRWISADVYMDTQDGILGTNMYAYCQNDCVNRYDPSGTLAFPGEIHAFVIADIMVKNPGVVAEQTIGYKVGWGRADLIRISTGEVWEVKPNKNKYFAGALKQLQKYINGIWKKRPAGNTTVLSIGGNYISNSRNTLDGTSWLDYESPWTGSMYKVKYINKGNGIIAYDYYLVPKAKAPVVLPEVSPEFVAEMEMVLAILAMLAGLYFGMPLPNAPVKIFGN